MALLSFTQLTPEEILLLENSKQVLTPEQKLDQFTKSKPINKFHFVAIESGNELILYNGIKEELNRFSNDFHGQREARVFAVDHFNSFPSDQAYGGYKFDFV